MWKPVRTELKGEILAVKDCDVWNIPSIFVGIIMIMISFKEYDDTVWGYVYIYIHTHMLFTVHVSFGVSSAFEVCVFQLGGSGARLAGLKEVNFLHLGSVISSHFSGVIQNYQYFWDQTWCIFFWWFLNDFPYNSLFGLVIQWPLFFFSHLVIWSYLFFQYTVYFWDFLGSSPSRFLVLKATFF